ncbi:nuclear receptor coactivator 7 isoform X1 [Megalops cyprinoides]|uniref:nuclear receptor coactivator 7 isoform X1 n=1 Tax=Megalops cyprinoides TaxID=118141 RepID=UPI001864B64D|nr:nuclear receptor coactivator 7 isoform X1 [Megalops cyprinoides]XP_036406262.1 nuclear receptor coactivator 7 isoform X1 [Megalops cyprinoides]
MEKERKPGYFARLKRRKQIKQDQSQSVAAGQKQSPPSLADVANATEEREETAPSAATGSDASKNPAATPGDLQGKSHGEDQQKESCPKSQSPQQDRKQHTDDVGSSKGQGKRDKRKPPGTVEYTVGPQDTLNSIALKFNITPNKLVQLNRLFSRSVVTGQILFVPDVGQAGTGPESSSPKISSSEQEDKLQDADSVCREAKPIRRMLSPPSEDEEPPTVKFLKMSCRYFTDGMGVVGGVMIVTPNNIMFDPHKSDPLVIEHGCEEYGLICPMEEVVSIALYDDISRMELKDALPSDLPQDLCPLYRPGAWEDLPSERDLNPFSRFEALKQDKGPIILDDIDSIVTDAGEQDAAEKSSPDEGFTELEVELSSNTDESHSRTGITSEVLEESIEKPIDPGMNSPSDSACGVLNKPDGEKEKEEDGPIDTHLTTDAGSPHNPVHRDILTASEGNSGISDGEGEHPACTTDNPIDVGSAGTEKLHNGVTDLPVNVAAKAVSGDHNRKLSLGENAGASGKCSQLSLSPAEEVMNGEGATPAPMTEEEERRQKSEEEMKSWLMKRMQAPIEDLLLSKEDKSKTPPMFLCFKVGKPMRKSFAIGRTSSPAHQYGRRGKQPEYWFAVPQERVDHLYNFFVQWSPDVYGKDSREPGFVVVEKDELDMIDNFFSDPTPRSWEIITVNEAKRRQSVSSFEDEEPLDLLPVLTDQSVLLEETHIEKLANHLPARTQGYPWQLVYSTAVHGTSLKTLYRNMTDLDCPVLLVIKNMDNQVFGAFSTHPFKISEHCYGTGETFLFSFNPEIKVYRWSGENSYFIKGNTDSLQLGGGGGHFGLWLDADLYHGSSSTCSTFRNQPLSTEQDFTVQDLEVWAFQ